jgi:ABC-type branched-subunit amino acid transport system substrate-binding protein
MQRRQLLAGAAASLAAPLLRAAPAGGADIVLGQSAVLSGPQGTQIQVFNKGAQMAFDQANAKGGVLGRPVKLLSLDDELKPDKAVANVKALLEEHKVLSLFGCVGSGTTAASGAVLAASGALSFGGYAVSDSAREKVKGQAYFVRAGYGREAEALVTLLQTVGITRVAVAALANPGGKEVTALLKQALESRKMTLSAAAEVAPDGKTLAQSVDDLAKAEAQAAVMFLSAPLAAGVMEGLWTKGQHPAFYGMSIVAGDAVAQKLGEKARGLAIAQAVPYPWQEANADVREYQRLSQAAKLPISYFAFEGYLNAQLQLEVLRRAGPNPSNAALHAAARGLKQRVAGMDVDFSHGGHTGSRLVELVQVTREGRFVR